MALTSTLFTGLSGLDANQAKLNVAGNNIANVNTVGFKGSRVLFKPQFYVTDSAGAPPSADFGGANPSQRGLGATVATVQKNYDPGSLETTGKPTDLAIDGAGFFIVQGKEQKFTRDGSFVLNQSNQITTTSGDFVQGFGVDTDGNVIPGQLQNLTIPLGSLTKSEVTTEVELQGNLNSAGAPATVGNIQLSQPLTDVGANASGDPPAGASLLTNLRPVDSSGVPGVGALFADGDVITLAAKRGGRTLPRLSNDATATSTVDELNTFLNQALGIEGGITSTTSTPGATLLGAASGTDPANSRRLRIESNVGTQNALSLAATKLGTDLAYQETSAAVGESVYTSFTVYDSLGSALQVNMVTVLESKTNLGTTWRFYAYSGNDTDAATFDPTGVTEGLNVGSATISFDTAGKLLTTTPLPVSIDRDLTGAGDPLSFALDFTQMNALADSSVNASNMFAEADGKPIGTLTSFAIASNGLILGSYDNGLQETLGQIAVATFDNPEGLIDTGGNMYIGGGNSGTAKVTAPLQLSAGGIRAGTLELSNVDLSDEFVNLIIASTGFSAASRVISTSNQLLTELLNTSR